MKKGHQLQVCEHRSLEVFGKFANGNSHFKNRMRELAHAPLQSALEAARKARPTRSSRRWPTSTSAPTLETITANDYWWGYAFVIPEAAMQALAQSSDIVATFVGLLGTIPEPVEDYAPLVEKYLTEHLALMQSADIGAGVFLSALILWPDTLFPIPIPWTFIASGLGNDLVLDVTGGNAAAGTPLDVYARKSSGYDNQLWTYVNDLYLVSKLVTDQGDSLVVDIAEQNPDAGAVVQLWTWNGGSNQMWTFDQGFVRSSLNQYVLDVETPGASVVMEPAASTSNQNQLWTTSFIE